MAESIRIACVGDMIPGGILHYESGDDFCGESLRDELSRADIRVATLETAIGDVPHFDEEKMKRDKDVIHCPTKDLCRLTSLGINVVSLANNHAWDLGQEGIEHTISELDRLGIKHCGAGLNLKEASEPAVVEVKGKKIAFIAYCDNNRGTCGYIPVATADKPGINALIEENIKQDILQLRNQYDYLFVMVHWGKEYYSYPMPQVNTLAKKMIEWGADGVIGSHSHQIQPTILYKGKPIIFSLGNFLFPDRIITEPRSTYYPEEKPDVKTLPTTTGFPMVKEPTFKVVKGIARKGQVVTLMCDNHSKQRFERKYTNSDKDSHIDLCVYNPPILFKLSHLLVKLPFYSALFFAMRCCRVLKKKLKGEL